MPGDLILLVDDEENILQLARMYLEREGFRVQTATTGPGGLEELRRGRPALMVLDVMLPGMDGFEVCKAVRAERDQTPIVMLTARDDDFDKILGLELGADDYLTKPFNPRELTARIKAVLRRAKPAETQAENVVRVADLVLDIERREVRVGERVVDLRTQEFEVLLVLARKPGRVFTRDDLLNLAWGFDFAGQTRTVDVHVGQIRKKLGDCQARIESVTGVGYKLAAA